MAGLQGYSHRDLHKALQRLIYHPPNDFSGCPNLPTFLRTLREIQEEISQKMQAAGEFKNHADRNCETCKGSSWVLTKDYSGNDAVYRCECWKRNTEGLVREPK
jgi:hypothetical protein